MVLQLSAWDGTQGPLGWVVDQVSRWYEVPADCVEEWLRTGRLVLLLDGLDEITDAERQRECVEALSALRNQVPTGMVVCCRSGDYRRIGKRLQFGLAVEILPLTPAQVESCLAAAGRQLAALRQAVRTDPVLAELLDTPLMLSVAAVVYRDSEPQQALRQGTREDRLAHLWDRYVATMLTRRRDPYADPPPPRMIGSRRTSPTSTWSGWPG